MIIGLGGVGGAASQIAKRIGAKVVGVARGAAATSPYVDAMVDSQAPDAIARIREATNGGAAVVFDTVGGSMFETALHMLKVGGRLVEISASDRREVTLQPRGFLSQREPADWRRYVEARSGCVRANAGSAASRLRRRQLQSAGHRADLRAGRCTSRLPGGGGRDERPRGADTANEAELTRCNAGDSQPQSILFAIFLGALAALPPISIDMALPALVDIASSLHASASQAGLTLSLFMAGFAVGPIVYGPLSDARGRKPTLLLGLALFTAGGIVSALAPGIGVLLGARSRAGHWGGRGHDGGAGYRARSVRRQRDAAPSRGHHRGRERSADCGAVYWRRIAGGDRMARDLRRHGGLRTAGCDSLRGPA